MSRSANAERIYQARKAATIERLVGAGIPREWALLWVAGYERDAAQMPHLLEAADFWQRAFDYIAREHAAGNRPQAIDYLERN